MCVAGDYIIELMCKTSTVNIYSIAKGKFLKTETITYNGNPTFGPNADFEPEGICQISEKEFMIGVARNSAKGNKSVLFYKGTIK